MDLSKTLKELRAWEVIAQAVKFSREKWTSAKGTQEAFEKSQRIPERPPSWNGLITQQFEGGEHQSRGS